MQKTILVGIDVSADDFTAAFDGTDDQPQVLSFPNSAAGHKRLCRRLQRAGRPARACLEATGIYSMDLSLALHRAKGIEIMVVNPRATKDFARACMKRSKTDRTDALSILEFVRRMPFAPWRPPSSETLNLRAISRRIAALMLTRIQERNRLKAVQRTREFSAGLGEDIEAHIEYLEQSMERLRGDALEIVDATPELRRRFMLLVSVKGISTKSAIRILGELAVLPEDMAARQWVAHAGLDPRHYESGSSVNKPTRISKTGNRHVRAALYMPALVAIRSEPCVQAFYQALLSRGKKPMQAIVAVMRKLLHAIYGMFSNDQSFIGEKFYRANA
jgi:transposase